MITGAIDVDTTQIAIAAIVIAGLFIRFGRGHSERELAHQERNHLDRERTALIARQNELIDILTQHYKEKV